MAAPPTMEKEATFSKDRSRTELAAYLQAVTTANVFFPVVIVALGVAGFASGYRLSSWVLPLAGLVVLASLRIFTRSWRCAGVVAIIFAVLHGGAYLVAGFFFDGSWDGLAFRQEAIIRLAEGWNPVFEKIGPLIQKHHVLINSYPEGSWIAGAAVLLSSGRIEPGKLFNFTLMLTAGSQVAATLLRLTSLRIPAITVIALLAVFNPVALSQCTTFCVDGMLASLLTITVAALVLYFVAPRWATLFLALLATGLMINLKFTGVVYAVILLSAAALALWYQRGLRSSLQLAVPAAMAGILALLFLGYAPYVWNLREKGHLFYPVMGRNAPDIMTKVRPLNLTDKDRVSRFLIANFSCSESVGRPPKATRLKFPFWIDRSEARWTWSLPAIESGGFGPFYGALLLLGAAGYIWVMADRSTRTNGRIALLIGGCLVISIFVHSETWWARWVPQAWLLPLIVAISCLLAPRHSGKWWLGSIILVLSTINVLLVGYYFARGQCAYTLATYRCLREISFVREPVYAYLGPLESLRQRLRATGAEIRILEAPSMAPSNSERHPIPSASDETFWTR